MDAGDLPDALGGDFRFHSEGAGDDAADALGSAAGSVELVDVMDLLHLGSVSLALQDLAAALDGGIEGIDSDGEVGGPDERLAGAAEGGEDVVADVVPAGGADYDCLELPCQFGVIGPEGLGGGEIYADALAGHLVGHGADVLRRAFDGYSALLQGLFHHVAHSSVSTNYNFHKSVCTLILRPPVRRGVSVHRRGGRGGSSRGRR